MSLAVLYQMYTYAGSYNVDNVVLIYPKKPDLDHIESTWTYADGKKLKVENQCLTSPPPGDLGDEFEAITLIINFF
jgi:5-methylcytosine-specific restriction endonuclease McrBC regulatory subunit McrC